MRFWLRYLALLALMLAASGLALALRPDRKIAAQEPPVDLQSMIPRAFGDWAEVSQSLQLVNPQQTEVLNRIYQQTLSRIYVNGNGDRVMLSIAYGDDQRDAVQLHYPEVCYPAQGFQVLSNREDRLQLPRGSIPVRRLETISGFQRREPVTYWTMIGKTAVLGGIDKKLVEMRYGLQKQIPDGLLFRVSSIDSDSERAFALQTSFVESLTTAIDPAVRQRIAGLQ